MRDRTANPLFAVFTDEPSWARELLSNIGEDLVFLSENNLSGRIGVLTEFKALMGCGHHIIANSAFSWWAAWLAAREGQVVVSPDRWDSERLVNIDEIAIPTWLQVAA